MAHEKRRLIIKSGNVFDSITGTIKENNTIAILGNQIVWVGEDDTFEKEANDQIINATEKIVVPGMIECHVHLGMTGTAQMERELVRTKTAMWPFYALNHAQKHLISGFTCVRDCGASPGWAAALRRIIQHGIFAGSRLVVADTGILQWGDQEAVFPQFYIDYLKSVREVTTGVDGVKHAVRERKMAGADFIKTATTGGVLHGIESKVGTSLWTDEELIAMREEAHRMEMHVACHAHGREGIYHAVKAGLDTIEHGSFIDEEIADLMVKKGTYLIPTQAAVLNLVKPEILKQLPPEVQKKTKEVAQKLKENQRMAFNKGVLFAVGTDAGTPGNLHGKTGVEIKYIVENVGMTPVQALQAATIQGAKAIRMDDKIGSIEKGKLADIVICDKNPLNEISVLENPMNFSSIIKDGKIMVEHGKITYFSA